MLGTFHGYVSACSHCYADIRLGQRRGIVDTIARHCHFPALSLIALNDFGLLVRQDLSNHFVDAKLSGDRVGGGTTIAGKHDDANALFVKLLDGLSSGLFDGIGNPQQAGDFSVYCHKHHSLAVHA